MTLRASDFDDTIRKALITQLRTQASVMMLLQRSALPAEIDTRERMRDALVAEGFRGRNIDLAYNQLAGHVISPGELLTHEEGMRWREHLTHVNTDLMPQFAPIPFVPSQMIDPSQWEVNDLVATGPEVEFANVNRPVTVATWAVLAGPFGPIRGDLVNYDLGLEVLRIRPEINAKRLQVGGVFTPWE